MTKTAIIPGSLKAISQRDNISLAESFLDCDALLLVDQSGSMAAKDAPIGKLEFGVNPFQSRYDAADQELARLQKELPGKVAVVAFSNTAVFCPGGVPMRLGGGTDMVEALKFVKVVDDTGIQIIMISDGEPNDENETLRVAKTFKTKISTIYIGPENGDGRQFLQQLARATGGEFHKSNAPGLLKESVETLLLKG